MAHVKTGLGLFGSALLVALGLCVSFWVGIAPVWSFDWQKAGLATCGSFPLGGLPPQLQLMVDFPFEVVAFMALHLGSAPAQQAKNAVEASNGFSVMACLWRSIGKSRFLHFLCSFFYDHLGCLRNLDKAWQRMATHGKAAKRLLLWSKTALLVLADSWQAVSPFLPSLPWPF